MSVKKYDSQSKILKLIAGGTLFADCPVGVINPYGGATAPDGWLLCHGQALSRTEYADLFAVIGTSFGSGDGSTTFNVPDLRGEFLRGAGSNSHTDQGHGGVVGAHQDATDIPYYYVAGNSTRRVDFFVKNQDVTYIHNYDANIGASTEGISIYTDNTWSGEYPMSASVRPTNTSVNYIIKAKQTPVPADVLTKLEELLADKDYLTFSGS